MQCAPYPHRAGRWAASGRVSQRRRLSQARPSLTVFEYPAGGSLTTYDVPILLRDTVWRKRQWHPVRPNQPEFNSLRRIQSLAGMNNDHIYRKLRKPRAGEPRQDLTYLPQTSSACPQPQGTPGQTWARQGRLGTPGQTWARQGRLGHARAGVGRRDACRIFLMLPCVRRES